MRKQIFLLLLAILFIVPMISAECAYYGTFKLNENITLVQTCSDCTWINITGVTAPDSSSALAETPMLVVGGQFQYLFTNASEMGTYTVTGRGDDSYADVWCYTFNTNGSGQIVSNSQTTLIIIGIVVMLIVCAFFFVLSMVFKHPGTKIFLMALSSITLIVLIGIIASNAETYLAEFPNLVNIYHTYYIAVIALAGAAMAGIIVWLIYFGVTTFNKSRGRSQDED